MNIIHDHLVNLELLPEKANILDLGCRDFVFTDNFRTSGHNVIAVDIDDFEGNYIRAAITDTDGFCYCKVENDPGATHIEHTNVGDKVEMMTLKTLSERVGVAKWDLIKMDIEGSEYNILKNGTHPLAKQITVEFHAHCTDQTKASLDELLDMLSEYYEIHNRVWDSQHGAGFNYWSVLLISK